MTPAVHPLQRIEARFSADPWPWAEANAAAIADDWAERIAVRPALFNGKVLLAKAERIEAGIYRADFFATDYAAFLFWLAHPGGETGVTNAFAMAALRAADGAFVLGEMGPQTANAGQLYFPAGTPDMDDVTLHGNVDLAGSVLRELAEETGLGVADVEASARWSAVTDGPRTALMREIVSPEPAERLAATIRRWLRGQSRPELCDVRIVRSDEDIDAARTPCFMQVYLRAAFAAQR